MSLPTGTVTFLLTDVESSAQAWERAPDAMRRALIRHDELALKIAAEHGGTIIKSRGEGDSLFLVFDVPASAVAAACALQLAFFDELWPEETPIRVRMALHVGSADLRDNDYYGPTVNRCARLRSLGQGGQTLLSEAARQAVADSLPDGAGLDDLGPQPLKDLTPERVWMLTHPNLPENRSLKPQLHNLPIQLTTFIGREHERGEVKHALETARLLTLTGAGGGGKTRIALQVAADRPEIEQDGVWLIELAPLTDEALVTDAVATVLKVREEKGRPLLQTLADALASRRLLLILDNCEHVLTAVARLADTLLRLCPHVRIMATSREGMGIAGEKIYRLPSLMMPDSRQPVMPHTLANYDAARLFIDRAVAVSPAFALTQTNAPAVAQVCRRLDGIPLAIELAAARIRVMPIEQIATRLNDRFRLLTGGSRAALPRQQTLRALIDWSYDLLTPPEKTLLRRLSVFSGGWTLEAAETICEGIEAKGIGVRASGVGQYEPLVQRKSEPIGEEERAGGEPSGIVNAESAQETLRNLPTPDTRTPIPLLESWEMLDLLMSLGDKSLVVYEEVNGVSRYRLLETVRQYSADRLQEEGEWEIFRARHADYFLTLAEQAAAQLIGPEQAQWLERLEAEHDNLRAAQDILCQDDAEKMLRLAAALWRFWLIRGHLSEGRTTLDAALAQNSSAEPTELRATALNGAAILATELGDLNGALALMQEALTIREKRGDAPKIAITRSNMGVQAMQRGDYETARAHLLAALPIFRQLNHTQGTAACLNNMGHVAHNLRDYETARACYEESLVLSRKGGDQAVTAVNLQLLGVVTREQGDFVTARRLIGEGLAIRRELGDQRGIADSLRYFAELSAALDDAERAALLFGAAEALRETIEAPLPASESGDHNRYVARARAALDPDAFAIAWERGRVMGIESALKFALEAA